MTAGWLHVQLYFGSCASAPPVPVGPALGRGAAGPASRSALSPFLCSARELDKVRQQLQEEVRQVSAQLLEERKKRETHEALARRLQKRVLLLTKVGARPAPAHGLPGWLCPASHVVGQDPCPFVHTFPQWPALAFSQSDASLGSVRVRPLLWKWGPGGLRGPCVLLVAGMVPVRT